LSFEIKEADMARLVWISELASRVALPRRWLQGEAEAGRIPALRVNRHFLFDPDAVRQTLRDRATKGDPIDGGMLNRASVRK
jgi:hypothetical protein